MALSGVLDVVRIFVIAAAAGGIMGIPAQLRRRPAGVRTHALVSLGAATFCVTARVVVETIADDPLRAVQGIASGVGFIGAASILRIDGAVEGINTAASVWIAAAVGCGIAFADTPAVGLLAAAVATAINWAFMELDARVLEPRQGPRSRERARGRRKWRRPRGR